MHVRAILVSAASALLVAGCGTASSEPPPSEPPPPWTCEDVPSSPYVLEAELKVRRSYPGFSKGGPPPEGTLTYEAKLAFDPCLRLDQTMQVLVRIPLGLVKAFEGTIDPTLGVTLLGYGDYDGHFSAGWPIEGTDVAFVVPIDERIARKQIHRARVSAYTLGPPREDEPAPFPVHIAIGDASCVRALADAWQREGSLVPIGDAAAACGEPLGRL